MDIPISLPLDSEGFVRRECPHCVEQFKWHHGAANEEAEEHPDPDTFYCPLCGQPAGTDSWWTQQQLDYMQGVAMPAAIQQMDDELGKVFRAAAFVQVGGDRSCHADWLGFSSIVDHMFALLHGSVSADRTPLISDVR